MPTHKELIEDLQFEIENLSSRVIDGSEALERQGQNQTQAAEIISKGLSDLGGDIIAAVVVAGFSSMVGRATSVVLDQL